MQIKDRGMVVNLENADPRAVKIRAILFEQPIADKPIATLWAACSSQQREVLIVLVKHGEMEQPALERQLGVTGIELRGRHSGLARIAKRLRVVYPIRSSAGRRESRRFSLDPSVTDEILKLANAHIKSGRKK